ncbi:MAG: hypothetical protein ABJE47_22460 [bacterium]
MTAAVMPFGLRLVDGCALDARYREVLQPGGVLIDHTGQARVLPRWFYEVESWEQARETLLAPHFAVSEFIHTDVREAPVLRVFPRYIPCATALLAIALEQFRAEVGTHVFIGANGGYCSPRHARLGGASPHSWGTAANIYRVGDTYLDNHADIARYARIITQLLPTAWTRPLGPELDWTDDHLHVDLGYVVSTPREAMDELHASHRKSPE